jgi:hypothetical protein
LTWALTCCTVGDRASKIIRVNVTIFRFIFLLHWPT